MSAFRALWFNFFLGVGHAWACKFFFALTMEYHESLSGPEFFVSYFFSLSSFICINVSRTSTPHLNLWQKTMCFLSFVQRLGRYSYIGLRIVPMYQCSSFCSQRLSWHVTRSYYIREINIMRCETGVPLFSRFKITWPENFMNNPVVCYYCTLGSTIKFCA